MSEYETFGGSRNAGYIKLLLAKYHNKSKKADYEGYENKWRDDRQVDTNFIIKR